jgi:hypothetical protein
MSIYFAEITGDKSILEAEKLIVSRRKGTDIASLTALPGTGAELT